MLFRSRARIGSSKTLASSYQASDLAARGFSKALQSSVNQLSDKASPQLTKAIKDFVIPLDYMEIFDGSTFEDVKRLFDVQPVVETLSRTVSYNRAYQDTDVVQDRPFKGLFKSFADEVSVFDFEEHNKRLLEDATDAFTTIDARDRKSTRLNSSH